MNLHNCIYNKIAIQNLSIYFDFVQHCPFKDIILLPPLFDYCNTVKQGHDLGLLLWWYMVVLMDIYYQNSALNFKLTHPNPTFDKTGAHKTYFQQWMFLMFSLFVYITNIYLVFLLIQLLFSNSYKTYVALSRVYGLNLELFVILLRNRFIFLKTVLSLILNHTIIFT